MKHITATLLILTFSTFLRYGNHTYNIGRTDGSIGITSNRNVGGDRSENDSIGTGNNDSPGVYEDYDWSPQVPGNYGQSTGAERLELLVDYLATYPEDQMSNWDINHAQKVLRYESCRGDISIPDCLDLRKTPPTWVQHCGRSDNTWYVVEGGDCLTDEITGRKEKSWGPAQILETTWGGNGCEGDIKTATYQQHMDCLVKIKNRSGWGQWSTNQMAINNLLSF